MKWWQRRSIFSTEEQVPYCLISIMSEKYKADVINYMAHYFQWSEKEKSVYSLQLESAIEEAIAPVVE